MYFSPTGIWNADVLKDWSLTTNKNYILIVYFVFLFAVTHNCAETCKLPVLVLWICSGHNPIVFISRVNIESRVCKNLESAGLKWCYTSWQYWWFLWFHIIHWLLSVWLKEVFICQCSGFVPVESSVRGKDIFSWSLSLKLSRWLVGVYAPNLLKIFEIFNGLNLLLEKT